MAICPLYPSITIWRNTDNNTNQKTLFSGRSKVHKARGKIVAFDSGLSLHIVSTVQFSLDLIRLTNFLED